MNCPLKRPMGPCNWVLWESPSVQPNQINPIFWENPFFALFCGQISPGYLQNTKNWFSKKIGFIWFGCTLSGTPTVPSYKVPLAVLVENSFNQKYVFRHIHISNPGIFTSPYCDCVTIMHFHDENIILILKPSCQVAIATENWNIFIDFMLG